MTFSKTTVMIILAFFVLMVGLVGSSEAADRDYSKKPRSGFSGTANTINPSCVVYKSYSKHSTSKTSYLRTKENQKTESKPTAVGFRPRSTGFIEAILDYDDYTHIFKLCENKE